MPDQNNMPAPHSGPGDDPLAPGDDLWDALGTTPLAEPEGWFAAKTMARLRREEEAPATWWERVFQPAALLRTALAGGSLAAIALVVALSLTTENQPTDAVAAAADVAFGQSDYELLTDTETETFTLAEAAPQEEPATNLAALDEGEPPIYQALEYLADGQTEELLFVELSLQ